MAKRAIVEHTAHVKPAVRIILKPLGRDGAWGMQQGRTLWVDPRSPYPVRILLHEQIHLENPCWSETRVRRETASRWRRMGWREKATLLRMFGRAKLGGEE